METDLSASPSPDFSNAFELSRALRHGWAAIKRCFPILWVGGCVRMCTSGGGGGGGGGGGDKEREGALLRDPGDTFASLSDAAANGSLPGPRLALASIGGAEGLLVLGILLLVLVILAIGVAFYAWFRPGWIRLHAEIARTGEGQWGTLFGTTEPFRRMVGWVLLRGAIGIGLLLLCLGPLAAAGVLTGDEMKPVIVAPALLVSVVAAIAAARVWIGISFGDALVSLDGATAMEALDRSWELTRNHGFGLLLFYLVLWLVGAVFALSGLCVFLVGVLVTGPLSYALIDFGFTESYLLYTRPEAETKAWSIWEWAR